MDGLRNTLYQQDVAELFGMLESQDLRTVEEVKSLIQENLNSVKGIGLLNGLIEYYIAVQSVRALDILVHIGELHHKHLFDKMIEYLKREDTRYQSLLLLSHLIHDQPPWLFKITQHRIFQALLHLLKTETAPCSLMCSLFSIVSLLPMIPYQIGSSLCDVFEIFSHLAAWSTKIQGVVPEIYLLHFQVGVYALFHRLYGMFPCNFLGYLRTYYGGRDYDEENVRVFVTTIKPMLERVRLHPSLVTSCKDSEVSQKRWKKFEAHDIVSLCASISLDPVYGTSEELSNKVSSYGSIISRSSPVQCQVGMDSVVDDSFINQTDNLLSSSQISGFSPPPPQTSSTQFSLIGQTDEIYAVENSTTIDNFSNGDNNALAVTDSKNEVYLEMSNNEKNELIGEAFEAKEDDIDKEVCELICDHSIFWNPDVQRDTPFGSTTQNLTDKTAPDSFETHEREYEEIWNESDISAQEQFKIESLVRTVNRLQYFSHCTLPSGTKTRLTQSMPNIFISEISTLPLNIETSLGDPSEDTASTIAAAQNITVSNSKCSLIDSVCFQDIHSAQTSHNHLMPLVLQTFTSRKFNNGTDVDTSCSSVAEHAQSTLSPTELLDRYLQLGCDVHLMQFASLSLTSPRNVNWTHFGGMPQCDEILLARTQVQLLYIQILFERHRREMHAERNRRLLGKTKRSRTQEETTSALKNQVSLLKKENIHMQNELKHQKKLYYQLELRKHEYESDFNSIISKLSQENNNLQYSNKKLQGLLVSQKQENDILQEDLKHSKSEVLKLEFELELLKTEADRAKKLDKENLFLAKENILLQEIAQWYHDKWQKNNELNQSEFENNLIEDSAVSEVKILKQVLESKCTVIDYLKGRVSGLEEEVIDVRARVLEQYQLSENLKAVHKDEIMAREERLLELKKILKHDLTHILELHCIQENLTSKLGKYADTQKLQPKENCSIDTQLFIQSEDYEILYIDEENMDSSDSSLT